MVDGIDLQNTLSFCDYLASGETMSDASARLQPLLGVHADLSQVSLIGWHCHHLAFAIQYAV